MTRASRDTGVCKKHTPLDPPDKKNLGSISVKNTKSGGGEQFLLCCKAKARRKGVLLSQTQVVEAEVLATRLAQLDTEVRAQSTPKVFEWEIWLRPSCSASFDV